MAKYGISAEGVSALRQLAKDMMTINSDIENNGRTLKAKVSGLGDDLGIYGEQILEMIESVNAAQVSGRESVEVLSGRVNQLADNVDALLRGGLS
ncbi:hypothetical protein [Fusibacter bizertensis]